MDKKILVRKSVLEALEALKKDAAANMDKPRHLAQKLMDKCEIVGDDAGKRFWRDVWIHLMLTECDPGDIQIIEDDEIKNPS